MGRWSGIEFEGRNARQIMIVTGYRSCNQQTRLGSSTFHDQQYRILLSRGITRPNPREQFLEDIITQVQQWHQTQKAVLICLDVNEDVTEMHQQHGLTRILAETDLVDLHSLRHPTTPRPSTYNRGTKTIDICLGSPEFASALVAASILPFGIPVLLPGDHHTLLLDFNSHILFGHAFPPPKYTYYRGVHSNLIPTVTKFSKMVGTACDAALISERISQIKNLAVLTADDHIALEAIDHDLTHILVKADHKCRKFNDSPWSRHSAKRTTNTAIGL